MHILAVHFSWRKGPEERTVECLHVLPFVVDVIPTLSLIAVHFDVFTATSNEWQEQHQVWRPRQIEYATVYWVSMLQYWVSMWKIVNDYYTFLHFLFCWMPHHGSADSEAEARGATHHGRAAPQQGHIHQPSGCVREVTDPSSACLCHKTSSTYAVANVQGYCVKEIWMISAFGREHCTLLPSLCGTSVAAWMQQVISKWLGSDICFPFLQWSHPQSPINALLKSCWVSGKPSGDCWNWSSRQRLCGKCSHFLYKMNHWKKSIQNLPS